MPISFDIPEDIARELTRQIGDLGQAAKEALIIDNYRQGRLSIGQVAGILGFRSRFQAEAWLGAHGIHWNYTAEDLENDRQAVEALLRADSR